MSRGPAKPRTGPAECRPKLNLFLEVLGRRPDGFHEIDTILVRVRGAADLLSLREVPGPGVALVAAGPFSHLLPPAAENLAVRAVRACLAAAGREPAVRLDLDKRLPPGSGLGGGSADAAAALRLAAGLLPGGAGIPGARPDLPVLAAGLGSDVPFLLEGGAACRARGRGERLEPVPAGAHAFLVLWPGAPCATAEVYARCRPPSPAERRGPDGVRAALAGSDPVALRRAVFNRLAEPAEAVCPAVRGARRRLEGLGQGPSFVTGSGSAAFVVLDRGADGDTLMARLAPREGEFAFLARCGAEGEA